MKRQLSVITVAFLVCGVMLGCEMELLANGHESFPHREANKEQVEIEDATEATNLPSTNKESQNGYEIIFPPTQNKAGDVLDLEIELQVKQTYFEWLFKADPSLIASPEHVYVQAYYGTYNGCVVVLMDYYGGLYADEIWWAICDGIGIYHRNSNSIMVWVSGELYWLSEAYNLGLLTGYDIQRIADIQNPFGCALPTLPFPWLAD